MAIWEHPCAAYARLRKKNKKRAGDLLKWQISIPMDSIYQFPGDTAKEIIRW
jgi:hypothetical protein